MPARIFFTDESEREKAIQHFYHDNELKDFELDSTDGESLLVSPDAVTRLRELGVDFEKL